ncbi:Proteasome component (PCI) domain-containing protein [Artemisia annua]|uniref:Proteasome component (PCI) domain-containing protein n=1 Tax=Artemisia annua TaxID=35608 RepID=A0A2U1M3L0_ARTAN|nr:Proteasome component (PCI) domain-containing protein [Artemisia annua]
MFPLFVHLLCLKMISLSTSIVFVDEINAVCTKRVRSMAHESFNLCCDLGSNQISYAQGGLIRLLRNIEKYDSSRGSRFRPMFMPLDLASNVQLLLAKIAKLVGKLSSASFVSQVYQTMKVETLSKMVPFFDFSAVERISVDAGKHSFISMKVDHMKGAIIFGGLGFQSDILQDHLSLLAVNLNKLRSMIYPSQTKASKLSAMLPILADIKAKKQALMELAMQEQVRQRHEMEKKMQKLTKTMDHLERAKREDTTPLIEAAFMDKYPLARSKTFNIDMPKVAFAHGPDNVNPQIKQIDKNGYLSFEMLADSMAELQIIKRARLINI